MKPRHLSMVSLLVICSPLCAESTTESGDDIADLIAVLNTPVISASKRIQKVMDSPQAVEVITADQIKASGAFRLVDVLRLATSVTVLDETPERAAVSIRGVNPSGIPYTVQLLIDGVPMFNIQAGTLNLNGLPVPLDAIERIEIVRGPSTSLYGANAQMGVISITTKLAKDGASGSLRAGLADHRTHREQGFFAYKTSPFAITAGVSAGTRGDLGRPMDIVATPDVKVPENTYTRDLQAFVRPEFTIADARLWAAWGTGNTGHGDQTAYYSPQALVPLVIYPNLRTTRELLQVGWDQVWSPTLKSEFKVNQKNYALQVDRILPVSASPTPTFLAQYLNANISPKGFYRDQVREVSMQFNWDPSATFHVVTGLDTKSIDSGESKINGFPEQKGLSASGGFLSADWTLDKLTLSGGARVANENLGGSYVCPRLSTVYKFDDTSIIRLGYFASARSPLVQERDTNLQDSPVATLIIIPNPDIQSEKVENWEVGFRKSWARWTLDCSYFRTQLRNMIAAKRTGAVINGKLEEQWRNAENTFQDTGFEVAITGELHPGWSMGFNGSTCSLKDPVSGLDAQADYSPRMQASLWSRYRQDRFFAFVGLHYTGSYTIVVPIGASRAQQTIDAATHVQFNIGVDLLKGLSVSAYGFNVTRPTSNVGTVEIWNTYGIRYSRREVGVQVSYQF